jgi:hypothetical protein
VTTVLRADHVDPETEFDGSQRQGGLASAAAFRLPALQSDPRPRGCYSRSPLPADGAVAGLGAAGEGPGAGAGGRGAGCGAPSGAVVQRLT